MSLPVILISADPSMPQALRARGIETALTSPKLAAEAAAYVPTVNVPSNMTLNLHGRNPNGTKKVIVPPAVPPPPPPPSGLGAMLERSLHLPDIDTASPGSSQSPLRPFFGQPPQDGEAAATTAATSSSSSSTQPLSPTALNRVLRLRVLERDQKKPGGTTAAAASGGVGGSSEGGAGGLAPQQQGERSPLAPGPPSRGRPPSIMEDLMPASAGAAGLDGPRKGDTATAPLDEPGGVSEAPALG